MFDRHPVLPVWLPWSLQPPMSDRTDPPLHLANEIYKPPIYSLNVSSKAYTWKACRFM